MRGSEKKACFHLALRTRVPLIQVALTLHRPELVLGVPRALRIRALMLDQHRRGPRLRNRVEMSVAPPALPKSREECKVVMPIMSSVTLRRPVTNPEVPVTPTRTKVFMSI